MAVVVEESDETIFWLEMLMDSAIIPEQRLSDLLREACSRLGSSKPPIVLSLQPLRDSGEAEFLGHEVPDVYVPDSVVDRLAKRDQDAGFRIALEVLRQSRDLIAGVVLVHREEPDQTWRDFVSEVGRSVRAPEAPRI